MNHHLTYRPQPAHIPADSLRADPCDTCDPRRFPRDPRRHSPPAHPILNSSFLILNWSYTFSAKERDSETGLSYFGARYYSSDLSIWLSVDPMASKYPSLSPYVYCADNPVKLVDPDGEEINISISEDKNGNKIVNINFTATLRNKTGKEISEKEMQNYKDKIAEGIKRFYGRNYDDKMKVNVNVDIDVLSKDDFWDPLTTRHEINIVDKLGDNHAGEAEIGGGKMYILLDVCEGKVNSLGRTAAHEFGHLLGLDHVSEDDNLMNETTDGGNITIRQIQEAYNNSHTKQINRNIRGIEHREYHDRRASVIYTKYKIQ